MKYILMDVEGTTTSISFVHDILFPFAKERLSSYILSHINLPEIQLVLTLTKETSLEEEQRSLDNFGAIQKLIQWIDEDRKHPALKNIQGMIWKEGYQSGLLKGHIYPEVPECLKKWHEANIKMGIYSSGSIEAQKDLFGYSEFGNLNHFISNNFDTTSGHKREEKSYLNIANELDIEPNEILFLSDISQELDAAEAVGFNTAQLLRLEELPYVGHLQVKSFFDIII